MAIMCYGDSLTAGFCKGGREYWPYAEVLEDRLHRPVLFYAVSGWTAEEMLRHKDNPECRDVAGLLAPGLGIVLQRESEAPETFSDTGESSRLRVMLLLAGTNDLADVTHDIDASAQRIVENIWGLHALCHEAGLRTVCIGIPAGRHQTQDMSVVRATVNLMLSGKCGSTPHADYVPFPIAYSRTNELWDLDGLHLSECGYGVLGTLLYRSVRVALGEVAPRPYRDCAPSDFR